MPGLDLSHLSSNWKRLQEKLRIDSKDEEPRPHAKRKRVDDSRTNRASIDAKRKRLMNSKPAEGHNMGYNISKSTRDSSHLVHDHGISKQDLKAAYGSNDLEDFDPNGFQDTINGGLHPTHKAGKYVALDCEMVGTGAPPHYSDNVLARVSLVNFHGQQLYDSYVQPPPNTTIHDYRTQYSGIRPHHLLPSSGARSFADVQRDVTRLIRGRVLVGHALKNDLQVLVCGHPREDVRDTSKYGKFREENGGRPPALRYLAKSKLGWQIQTGEHSSVEDARAAMMLVRKEKVGFEEENRRNFGAPSQRKNVGGSGKKATGPAGRDGGEDEDSDEELDVLDGEDEGSLEHDEDGIEAEKGPLSPGLKRKKKRKKKSRTKRK